MQKFLFPTALAVLVFTILFFATPTRTIGTGILLDKDGRLIVLTSLVENASDIIVKFPNADNIHAKKTGKTASNLLSVFQLETLPKVERTSVQFSDSFRIKKGDYLFALFYPIANTQEDKHILREGNITSANGPGGDNRFFEIDFPVNPGEGGGPLFNSKGEVVGITLSAQDIQKVLGSDLKVSNLKGYGLKNSAIKGLKKIIYQKPLSPSSLSKRQLDLSRGLAYFIEGIQKNIVLIETET
jgi:S1-C subfamily serine protease